MSQYDELNTLLGKLYRYETEIMGGNSKVGEIDVLKIEINRLLAKIKSSIHERNNLRVKKEKGTTKTLLKLSSEIKKDIERAEAMLRDFELMISNRQMSNKANVENILTSFRKLLSKLQETESENILISTQPDKFSGIDFSKIISNVK
jgi:hypothetical protein